MVKAVVFDAYGTLVHITRPTRPYTRLFRLAGSALNGIDPHDLLRSPMDLDDVACALGLTLSPHEMTRLYRLQQQELASIQPYPETAVVLQTLVERGMRVGVCSNLAEPYAAPVLENLPLTPHAVAWSFAEGAIKPEPDIYAAIANRLELAPADIHFVGDTYAADVEGPRAFGMQATHLQRRPRRPAAEPGIADLTSLLEIVKSYERE